MAEAKCADCGKKVVMHRGGKWAEELGDTAYSFTCRTVIEGSQLVRADYHYVEGEKQRHWAPSAL